jgi:hypothetical protein
MSVLTQYCLGDEIENNNISSECRVCGEEEGRIQGFGGRNLSVRHHSGELGRDGRIILKWTFRKWDVEVCTGSSWPRKGQVAGTYECGKEPTGSIKCGEFLE